MNEDKDMAVLPDHVEDDGLKPDIEAKDRDTSLTAIGGRAGVNDRRDNALYQEALARYPNDAAIDPADEKKLVRKLDRRVLWILGVCYFFYYVDKTTLSYAAIFGIKTDLHLVGDEYSWLSSVFYFGWLVWSIPSNLLLQRSPPAYYLALNIFLWGVFLMVQAAVNSFASLAVLRVISGAFEAIADPAFMLFTSMFYTKDEQPWRISAWYLWNGLGVAGGGILGYGIGQIRGHLASWRYEFLIVGALCAAWGLALFVLLPNAPGQFRGFSHDESLLLIARMRRNQSTFEQTRVNWRHIREALLDYKTWLFFLLGFVSAVPNGGISNFSTLVIQGLGFDTLHTALLGIPQGVTVVVWILLGALANHYMPPNSRTLVCAVFMLPTIAGALGFLLAPDDAYVGRLICFYLTGSYQASFVICLSLVTSNTGGQSKKMIVSGIIWLGSCIGSISSPFFYKADQAPKYALGIGSLLVTNIIELLLFFVFRYSFIYENKRKQRQRAALQTAAENGNEGASTVPGLNETAIGDLTDRENPNFVYVY
ncbi:uncharacterized protein SPSK_03257 [Sporothrix schenckii 1099-18]|uniref:Major facilitator superfamily (MFS) profile domain-containing protein n=1 Tax=Sporothrix schenckii 1099-18 TaxID=1397361 RepID=A0A0F2LWZ5_SPOSC|nr:uncharacterized protein SPSK_03257 [Sporothrix schenckii 1099-18]KJR81973.1 hypothetical protein SPSK_03257 [Sporothrix schenckii 1099-18]